MMGPRPNNFSMLESTARSAKHSPAGAIGGHIHNAQIADLFNRYAVLLEMQGVNPFRVRAYHNAARTLENLPRDINMLIGEGFDLTELPGIGKDLAGKISTIAATGRFLPLEQIKKKLPGGLAELAELPGLGPKKTQILFRKLKIATVPALLAAARSGRLQKLKGFGPKTEANIIKAASRFAAAGKRLRLSTAEQVALPLLTYLKTVPGIKKAEIAGSFRRRRDTVGDIDILVSCEPTGDPIGAFVTYPEVVEVMAKGATRATVRLKSGLQVDLRLVPERSYGAALIYFTGSKAHNIALRAIAMKQGLKFNEYGVFRGERWLAGRTEAEVYTKAKLPYIEPELRENSGELEAARENRLPHLVSLSNIRGDLHAHTKASDGDASIEEMAAGARNLGYQYLAITDHTEHVGIVHGLDHRRLAQQMAAIDKLNAKFHGFRLLKSAEVDILPDGKLAIDPGIARELDIVVAAVHTGFGSSAARQTDRLLRAMDHPFVNIIAHPTGRLLSERDPYPLDMQRVMEGAIQRGCFLEANAQPSRLDLNDIHCRMAKDLGLKLVISTDAHSVETLSYMRFGVDQARRGWLEAGDILNTKSLAGLIKALRR